MTCFDKFFFIAGLVSFGAILYQPTLYAQSPTASISGQVTDQSKAVISGAQVEAVDVDRQTHTRTITNGNGFYRFNDLSPGHYRLITSRDGFRTIIQSEVLLQVQDQLAQNFEMMVGSTDQSITVEGTASIVQTQDASVGVVIDKTFVSNLPLNGRSFQSLIELTPGYVGPIATGSSLGQFAVNGQRSSANYMTVDGVSVNFAISAGGSGTGNGDAAVTSALGTTTSLTSIDALEEFKVLTSSFAPEFGRTPGAQVIAVTRSGTNVFHVSLYEYFRNNVLNANDWFANANRLKRAPLRHNDFGGTIGGPIWKNKTFFFFSQEDVRLTQPTTITGTVPSLSVRQTASGTAVAPFLNLFPLPTGPDTANGYSSYAASVSPPSSLDATSLRLDHQLGSFMQFFYRLSYSPASRGNAPAFVGINEQYTQTQTTTHTGGLSWTASPLLTGEMRINWSRQNASTKIVSPVDSQVQSSFPTGTEVQLSGLSTPAITLQGGAYDRITQFNLVPSMSWLIHRHLVKFGFDYRRLSPQFRPQETTYQLIFANPISSLTQNIGNFYIYEQLPTKVLLQNYSTFIQDSWSVTPNLHLTYGLRWDYNPTPSNETGQGLLVVGLSGNPPVPTVLPPNSPLWHSPVANIAPRVGVAWQINSRPGRELVLRAGGGLFFDLGWDFSTSAINQNPMYSASVTSASVPLPLTPSSLTPPTPGPRAVYSGIVYSFQEQAKLPRVWQSNISLEQALGRSQSITLSYVGAFGRDLTTEVAAPASGIFPTTILEQHDGSSDYNAMQFVFRRHILEKFQLLGSYTWAHAIDDFTGGVVSIRNGGTSAIYADRGSSDFDIRQSFSTGFSYVIPSRIHLAMFNPLLSGWGVDGVIQARSGLPINVTNSILTSSGTYVIRPNLVPGVPLWIASGNVAGGRRINSSAFVTPSIVEEGDLGRNALRGFGFAQADLALKRSFQFLERLKLTVRVEAYNLTNHPSFAQPASNLKSGTFGITTSMLGTSTGALGLNPLYNVGQTRSLQLAIRLEF